MKRAFRLEGLDCAVCASKIETGVRAIAGVSAAQLNFMTARLVIEGDDANVEDIISKMKKIVKKVDPDIIIKRA
ncbi:MAG: cation transporter [Oscillospiraceae bacterium]|jgi:copper chaperone CopZ|nr:cation transporter [Oscillospiraceae bacterium]